MKKVLCFALIAVMSLAVVSCKKSEFKGLKYDGMMADDNTDSWLQANVVNKDGKKVMWFQFFDQVDKKSEIESYKDSSEKVGTFPASVNKDKHVWTLINNRFEIRLIADDESKDYQNTEKLKKFILAFDIDGMSKVAGDKLTAKAMEKFLPKLK
ncbi:MAG: hypothetical protein GY754_15865 [bacterium]|nr:hypothetical protein [bacterium]